MDSLMENSMGQNGFEFITDTAKHSIPTGFMFTSIVPATDIIIAAYTVESGASISGNTFTGVTLPAGVTIYGRFTSITLTSGSCFAYKGR